MLNAIRQLPDILMLTIMLFFGFIEWCLIRCIPILWDLLKRTAAYKFVQLSHENARLRRRLRKMQEEYIRGRV